MFRTPRLQFLSRFPIQVRQATLSALAILLSAFPEFFGHDAALLKNKGVVYILNNRIKCNTIELFTAISMDRDHHQQFGEIYDAYAKAIFRFIYFRVSEHGLAEDIAHDTFLQFWKVLSSGADIRDSRALLYTMARGIVIDHYRKKNYRIHISLDIEKIDDELALATDALENEIATKEELKNVLAKLKTIKQDYQDALLMYYVEELEIPEIARILGKKENAVRVLIHRALKALKNKL